ncbi:MAG: winged helix-turn-helix transcriptional regulator [Spirochaetes bacterium]|nr:winged helix-turn-helix transcriptional regulator [Spirochaetota bacterium]
MNEYIKKLKCLGDETRIRILKLLITVNKELCVCEIVDSLKIQTYTISKHIKELKNAGILKESRRGKFIFYSLILNEDNFSENVINLINSLPDAYFSDDILMMNKRLSRRETDSCATGLSDKGDDK